MIQIALIQGEYRLLGQVGSGVWEHLWSFPFQGPFSQALAYREAVRAAIVYTVLCGENNAV